MNLSLKEMHNLASISRLSFSLDEQHGINETMNDVLNYSSELMKSVDDRVQDSREQPMVLREDAHYTSSCNVLSLCNHVHDRYIVVPAIITK